MPEFEYQLKVIINGQPTIKIWDGKDGLDASKRYQDNHPDQKVVAWREVPCGVFIMGDARNIIE